MHRRSDAPPSSARARSLADLSLSRRAPPRAAALALAVDGYHYRCNARFIRGRQFARVALTVGQNASGLESELHLESNPTPWAQCFPLNFSKRGLLGMGIVLLFSTFDIQVTFPFPSPLSIPHTRPTEATI